MPQLASNGSNTTYADELRLRVQRMGKLLDRVVPVPAEWLAVTKRQERIESVTCTSWATVEGSWQRCVRWRRGLSDMLSTMLAVAASTSQTGNQLHMLVVASAGSMKTTLADAMLVSKKCKVVEGITGFTSGAKSDDGRDLSFLARANHLTWITPEGDVMVTSPLFAEIMAQARRIFDGKYSQVYKTTDEDLNFEGLRTPWIICGTPFMIDYWDQSRLGDRFLRFWLDDPVDDERRKIVLAAMDSEWAAVAEHSNGDSGGVEAKLRRAYALTGGYVDWLRDNVSTIDRVTVSVADVHRIADYAEFAADMRAKPNTDPRKLDCHDTKELPTRIGRQLVRLARCYGYVLNKSTVDGDVIRLVRDRALDTSRGKTLELLALFYKTNPHTGVSYQRGGGHTISWLSSFGGFESQPKCLAYLNFLSKIGVVEHVVQQGSHGHWRLTARVDGLYRSVVGGV